LVADRSGASAIIGITNGQFQVLPETRCRGFGFGHRILDAALATNSTPTVTNGFKILRDCRQTGAYATKYSNIYDLKTGEIFLYPLPDRDDEVTLSLAAELKKGPHYYEMPEIQKELAQAPRPLPVNMERFPLDDYQPIPDKEPEVTARVRTMINDLLHDTAHREDFADQAWQGIVLHLPGTWPGTEWLGDLVSMTLVSRSETNGLRYYRYRMEFDRAMLLQRVVLTGEGKWADGGAEVMELKSGTLHRTPLVGIGVQLRADGSNIVVQAIIPGSPAAHQKDLRAGDRVLAVAQDTGPVVPVASGQMRLAANMIRGAAGTTVRLTVVSPGEPESSARVVSLVRANLEPLIQ
jgi:hypothetical protein